MNPYFRDARIRRCLLDAGLINRYGDILRGAAAEEAVARSPGRRRTAQSNKSAGLRRSNSRSLSTVRRQPQTDNEKRPKSAHPSTGNERALATRRPATGRKRSPPVPPSPPPKKLCQLTMRYLKSQPKIDYDLSWLPQKGDEIIVMQQHCGGENLTVFKGFVEPSGKFSFYSQRHADYPFALAFYINGLIDSRISVCCEYRHKKHTPLGGSSGSFAIINVENVTPCRSCRLRRLKKKGQSRLSLGPEATRYRRSIVPNTQHIRRSPSLPRPQSPTPPPELDEKKSKAHRSAKKKAVQLPPSSSSSSEQSIKPTKGSERVEEQKPTERKSSTDTLDSEEKRTPPSKVVRRLSKENSQSSRSATPPFRRKSPALSTDKSSTASSPTHPNLADDQKQGTVISKSDDRLSNASSEKTDLSINQQDLQSPSKDPVRKRNGNYSTDFDEASEEEKPTAPTRFTTQRRTSVSNSIDSKKKQSDPFGASDYPSKSTLRKSISSSSTETLKHLRDSLPSPDEDKQPPETATAGYTRPKTSKVRRSPSHSSEDFLGIKPASPRAQKKSAPSFEDDFFQSESREKPANASSHTRSWRDDHFFD